MRTALRRRYGRTAGRVGEKLVAVRLDDPRFGSGPGTIVAYPKSIVEYHELVTDRDGARDRRMRLWTVRDGDTVPIGARVSAGLVRGTGIGVLRKEPS